MEFRLKGIYVDQLMALLLRLIFSFSANALV